MDKDAKADNSIGIVIPVYNGESFIAAAIDSVLGQDLPPDEFFVFDNGSTDGTLQILQTYQKIHGISVISAEKHFPRMVDSWNFAAEQLTTQWFHLMSADDVLRSCFVRKFKEQQDADCAAISMISEEMDELGKVVLAKFSLGNTRIIQGADLVLANLFSSSINVASVVVRKLAWKAAGGYPSEYSYWHDMVLWQRLASVGGVKKVNQVVARYRVDRTKQKSDFRARGIELDRNIYIDSELPRLQKLWGIDLPRESSAEPSFKTSSRRIVVLGLSRLKIVLYKVGWAKW